VDDHVLHTSADGNLLSISGAGYPAWTGGALRFIDSIGISEFVLRANELEQCYGNAFSLPQSIQERLDANRTFE
jgi:3-hydroxyacyl-CoA dehydrogenase/enoyl-CoA hydratase/3-hydroxybutyryl-CoA epimerase